MWINKKYLFLPRLCILSRTGLMWNVVFGSPYPQLDKFIWGEKLIIFPVCAWPAGNSYDWPHAPIPADNKLPLFYILILPPVINVNIHQGYNGSLMLQIGTIYSWEIEKSEMMITKTVLIIIWVERWAGNKSMSSIPTLASHR